MKLLLDTCTFLWLTTTPDRLSEHARELFQEPTNACYLSAASVWEIAIKYGLKRLPLPAQPSRFVPQAFHIAIMPDAVGALIGPRGANIKAITASTGARVSVDDTGMVLIYATDQTSATKAKLMVQRSAGVLHVGRCYRGTVTGVKDFGAFVKINAVNEGLVPIEELANEHLECAGDVAVEGEEMIVAVLGADDRGRLRLSRRQALGVGESLIEF